MGDIAEILIMAPVAAALAIVLIKVCVKITARYVYKSNLLSQRLYTVNHYCINNASGFLSQIFCTVNQNQNHNALQLQF